LKGSYVMKKMLSLILACVMCLSLVFTALASEAPVNQLPTASQAFESEALIDQPPTSRAWDGPYLDPDIDLFANATYWYQNDTIWNGRSNNTFYFRLDEDFQYAKIWVQNNSDGPIVVSTSYNGKDFGNTYTIEKDKSCPPIYVAGNGNTGEFHVNVNADQGVILKGLISIRTGTKVGVGYPW